MSYHVFFMFSSGLSAPLNVPPGTFKGLMDEGPYTSRTLLGLEPSEWSSAAEKMRDPTVDEVRAWRKSGLLHGGNTHYSADHHESYAREMRQYILCKAFEEHNGFVERTYHAFAKWGEAKADFFDAYGRPCAADAPGAKPAEIITPEMAAEFWPFLTHIGPIPPEMWTKDFAKERNEHIYRVLRGNEDEGVTFNADALTPEQAAAVLNLFSEFIDPHDMRFDVPKGHDRVECSYDGGYVWCEECGAVDPDDGCVGKKGKECPARESLGYGDEEDEPDDEGDG